MTIGDLMTAIIAKVTPDVSLVTVVAMMRDKKCSCVLVVVDDYPKGIITEREIVRVFATVVERKDMPELTVGEVMTVDPVCVQQDVFLYDALILARSRKLRHLLVVNEDGKLVGLVTHTDMVNAYVQLVERQSRLEFENQQLHLLSNEDALMKIGNRRAMEVELAFTEASAKRYNKSYGIALIDVDLFKRYNDCYGHQQGDEALKALANIIKAAMRDTDRVYRYGGEEILLLMSETSGADALRVAERIRRAVESAQWPHQQSPYNTLTISIGVSVGQQDPWQDLIDRADGALYRAKADGRNTVILDEPN
ncbi:MAG: diguanylate cyclase [Spongiibacteraceae bacterium]